MVYIKKSSNKMEAETNLSSVPISLTNVSSYQQQNMSGVTEDSQVSLEQILPTLVQIFVTMLLGWLTGFYKIIGPSEAAGLNIFVSKFSLPSLIFVSMATVDFTQINLAFLLGIFASKAAVFTFIVMVQVVIKKDCSAAAVYAMFCTQTNDLGMGVPLLDAVFGKNHIFVSYLYLTSAISLLVLNPVGFIMLETNRKTGESKGAWKSIPLVFKGLALNPIVAMTFLGVIANLLLQGQPPEALTLLLSKLGAAFGACAPFTLGLGMVGKFKHIKSQNLPTLIGLMIVKCLLTPILSYGLVAQIHDSLYGFVDRKLVNFAFLYGTFPTALGVMSYAAQYQTFPELVSAGIVLCTMVSAPLMYVSAEILKVYQLDFEDEIINQSSCFNIAVASIVGSFIVLIIFLMSKRFLVMPHTITTSLILQCLISPIGSVLGFFNLINSQWQEFLHNTGVFSVQITSTFLAISLLLIMQKKTIPNFRKICFIVGGPILSIAVMLVLTLNEAIKDTEDNMAYDAAKNLNIAAVFVNFLSLVVTSTTLALIHRLKRIQARESKLDDGKNADYGSSQMSSSSSFSDKSSTPHTQQIFRHSLLVMLMCCSMVAGLTIPLWRLSTKHLETDTGAYKVMLYLTKMVTTGQGLLVLSVFSLDWEYILNPVKSGVLWLNEKIKGEKEEIPDFPVMMPVTIFHQVMLPASLLTNIALSLVPAITEEDKRLTGSAQFARLEEETGRKSKIVTAKKNIDSEENPKDYVEELLEPSPTK